MKNEVVQKPITLLREDFLNGLLKLCNDSGLPYFVIEDVMKEVIDQVHIASRKQLEVDRENYYQEIHRSEFNADNN